MASCAPATSVQWNMHATLINADGITEDTFSLPVVGTVTENNRHYLNLEVELPKSIPYRMSVSEPDGDPVDPTIFGRKGDMATQAFCYDVTTNSLALMMWAINTEKKYFIAYWGADYGKFLVASVDPNVKTEEILKHFDYLVEHMKQTLDTALE